MLLFYTLFIWHTQAIPNNQFNMHKINNHLDGYCLFYHSYENYNILSGFLDNNDGSIKNQIHLQIIPYCLRSSSEEENSSILEFLNNTNNIDSIFTFVELKQQNITSQMLLSWSSSIDIAEQYQIFLNKDSNFLPEAELTFYNCTSLWFGPFCRFMFDYLIDKTFDDIVDSIFKSKSSLEENTKLSCYKHLNCQSLFSCLDWREICDQKIDCLDGSDENHCWQLEVNECTSHEFRCHNGQCIPIEFYHDGFEELECLDRTDESTFYGIFSNDCYKTPLFQCEEHTCIQGNYDFKCDDGQCGFSTFRCSNGRNTLLSDDFCSNATACFMELYTLVDYQWCERFCSETSCIRDNCPLIYEFHYYPLILGHIRFMYSNKEIEFGRNLLPEYICYNDKRCQDIFPGKLIGNYTCIHLDELGLENSNFLNWENFLNVIRARFRPCLTTMNEIHYCNYSMMYQCVNSTKCVSKQRLLDGFQDCPFNDDETFNESCSLSDVYQRFNCTVSGNKKCLSSLVVENHETDCDNNEDENEEWSMARKHINFQTMCDGKQDLSAVFIDGKHQTDETNCEHWECNNTYTRCNGIWTCPNGADEIDCQSSTCPPLHHSCVFPNDTSKVSCLPIGLAGNGIIDCLGATDERTNYDVYGNDMGYSNFFRCWNDTKLLESTFFCDRISDCPFNDDESFCRTLGSPYDSICDYSHGLLTEVEFYFCSFVFRIQYLQSIYFKLWNIPNYPKYITTQNSSLLLPIRVYTHSIIQNPTKYVTSIDVWWCNRGVPIRIHINANSSELTCLCPPSYYGNRCQYQNQRVSITLQIRASSNWRNTFIVLITLIDDKGDIESYDDIQYIPMQDCNNKFNLYLLYSTRPKQAFKNYSAKIDVFIQTIHNYRASWIFPLRFSFLPVHRLPIFLKVPFSNVKPIYRCWPPCIHGQCFAYINVPNMTFCRCESGWSGIQCNIKYECECAPNSLCISNTICLCPPDYFGRRCYLFRSSCDSELCLNGGQCVIPYITKDQGESKCICPEGYEGDHCQYQQKQTRIDISFHDKLIIPTELLVHFIAVRNSDNPNRTSIIKKIPFNHYSLTLFIKVSFNIAFARMFNEYYLIILQEKKIIIANISTQIIPSHRCQSIGELFNETFARLHLLTRIKYYHVPCKRNLELICFYDDVHFCLCTRDRTANCFEFDHDMSYDCGGFNYCENDGACFQDSFFCPKSSFCSCAECFFGSKCQFSTKESRLSLDIILNYYIQRNINIDQQPTIVKVAIVFTTFILIVGVINSLFCFQTFRRNETRNVGCGLYLLTSSIISLIVVIILALKFSFLLASQIGLISNRSLIYAQCMLIDFLLQFFLTTNDWLNACVAIERSISIIQGVKFNKEKSKQVAKWLILFVLVFISCSYIYDPFHRRLIDDEEEQRTWCVSKYSSSLQIFDWTLNIFHYSLPFAINCTSAFTIIIIAARIRSNFQKRKKLIEHLREQLYRHKHLLISPCILILLAVPRLIMSFLSGCMKSPRDSWFYLIGYFVSFIPSMITFIVFVLPSDIYRKGFIQAMKCI